MVTIRLARHGSKKNPFYQITVADRSAGRDGRFVERIGFYNPVARGADEALRMDVDRADYWISQGARPSDRVKQLLARARKNLAASPASGTASPASGTASPASGTASTAAATAE
jgi:small subunit ribosomal protein S16